MMLADLGADVIKIESPEGDPYRSYQGDQYSPHFQAYNRNKRSLALDLKSPADRDAVRRPDPRGRRLHPELPPRHRGAPRRRRRSSCSEHQPAPGLLLDQRLRRQRPVRRPAELRLGRAGAERLPERRRRLRSGPQFLGPALADAITGLYAAYGVLGALVQRGRSGEGCLVEVSMLEAMAHFAVEPFAAFFALGKVPTSSGPAAPRAGLHPAHRRRAPDRDPPVVAGEVLEGAHRRAGCARARRPIRASARATRASHTTRRCAPSSTRASRATAAALDRAAGTQRRAVRADQRHRRGHRRIRRCSTSGLIVPVQNAHRTARAVRPPVQFDGGALQFGPRCAAAGRARRRDPRGAGGQRRLAGACGAPWRDARLKVPESRGADAVSDDTGGQLPAAGVAHRSPAARRALSAARARARAVARARALARRGAGRRDDRGDQGAGGCRPRHHHRRGDPSRELFQSVRHRARRRGPGQPRHCARSQRPPQSGAARRRARSGGATPVGVADVEFLLRHTQPARQGHRAGPVHDVAAGADRFLRRQPASSPRWTTRWR